MFPSDDQNQLHIVFHRQQQLKGSEVSVSNIQIHNQQSNLFKVPRYKLIWPVLRYNVAWSVLWAGHELVTGKC